mgnify:CR=1 FL=1
MAADPTLVRAAFSEAESRARTTVPSMAPLFKSNMEISKQMVAGVEKIFAELEQDEKEREIGAENQLQVFRGKLNTAFESLYNEKQPLPIKVHDAIYDQLKDVQAQFELVNTYGDDDNPENEKARALLTVRLQKIIGQAVKARGKLTTIAAMKENVSGDQESLDIASEIWDVTGNYDKIEMTFNEKDELVWNVTLPEYWQSGKPGEVGFSTWDEKQSWTVADMEKNLKIKNYYKSGVEGDPNAMTAQNYELSRYEALEKLGRSEKGGEFNESRELGDIKNNLLAKKDPNMLAAIAIQEMDGNPSWRKSLMVNPEIARSAVEHLFIGDVQIGFTFEDMDRDEDGKIEMEDAMEITDPEQRRLWKLNFNQIVDALTNPMANGFNYARSENMLADFLVDRRKQAFKVGKDQRPPATDIDSIGINPDVYYPIGQGDVTVLGSSLEPRYNSFVNNVEFDSYDGKFQFVPSTKGGWTVNEIDVNGEVINTKEISQYGLAKKMGFYENAGRLGLDVSKLSTAGGSDTTEDDTIIKPDTFDNLAKKKYGSGLKSQSIAPKALFKTIDSHSSYGFNKTTSWPSGAGIKTKENLITLADRIDEVWVKDTGNTRANDLMDKINKQNNTSINVKHLSKMIRDLAENMGASGIDEEQI